MPAAPATPAGPLKVGDTIRDAAGGEVGTVASIAGGNVVVKTDRHEVGLASSSFTATPTGYIISPTRAQLNATVDAATAATGRLLVAGATVRDPAGATVGTIVSTDAEFVTVRIGEGPFRIPRGSFAATPDGLVISSTAAEITAATKAAE